MAGLLSTKILVGFSCDMPNYFNKFLSKTAWQTHEVVAMYSALEVERVIIGYFFDIQVKVVFPMKNTNSLVLFQSSSSPTQLL